MRTRPAGGRRRDQGKALGRIMQADDPFAQPVQVGA
jgi:hypothetical protein